MSSAPVKRKRVHSDESDLLATLHKLEFQPLPTHVHVVCMVVNEFEFEAAANNLHIEHKAKLKGLIVYIGHVKGVNERITALLCQQPNKGGSLGPAKSQQLTTNILQRVRTKLVAAVGVAYGQDPATHKLHDVLVSTDVMPYESQRVGVMPMDAESEGGSSSGQKGRPAVKNRNKPLAVDENLAVTINSIASKWDASAEGCAIHLGTILCGEKLTDNPTLKEQNLSMAHVPAAVVGGEMESTGIFTACAGVGIPCVTIKAVCDFGDGGKTLLHSTSDQKGKIQVGASSNAWKFLVKLLEAMDLKFAKGQTTLRTQLLDVTENPHFEKVAKLARLELAAQAESEKNRADALFMQKQRDLAEATAEVTKAKAAVATLNQAILSMKPLAAKCDAESQILGKSWPFGSQCVTATVDDTVWQFRRREKLGRLSISAAVAKSYMDPSTFDDLEEEARAPSTFTVKAQQKGPK